MVQASDELVVIAPPLPEGTAPTPVEELAILRDNLEHHKKILPQIISVMQKRTREVYMKQRDLTQQYKRLQESWLKKVRELEEAKPVGKTKKRPGPRGVCFFSTFFLYYYYIAVEYQLIFMFIATCIACSISSSGSNGGGGSSSCSSSSVSIGPWYTSF